MSGATAVFFISSGVGGVFVARLLRRVDPRPLIVIGSVLAAASLLVLGRATAVWHVYVIYVFFGLGFSFSGMVVTNTVVTRWFHRRRSVAMSYSSTGLSVGGIVLTPLAKLLIGNHGLHNATPWLALLYLVGSIPIPLLLLKPDPRQMGLAPDGDALVDRPDGVAAVAPGVDYAEAVRSAVFVAVTLGFLLALMSQVGGIAQLVKVSKERAGSATAGRAVSVLAFCSVIGRLAGGRIVSAVSTRTFSIVSLLVQASGMLAVAFAHGSTALLMSVALFGLGVGNVLLLHPLLLAEIFGVRDYARIYSRSQMFVSLGIASGPLLLGYLRDHAGGYRTSYVFAFAITMVGVAVYAWKGTPAEPATA